jgi:acid phosphatase type 7
MLRRRFAAWLALSVLTSCRAKAPPADEPSLPAVGGGPASASGGHPATGGTPNATGGNSAGGSGSGGAGNGGTTGTGGTSTGGTSVPPGTGGEGNPDPKPEPGTDVVPPEASMVIAAAGDIAAATGGDEKTTATLLHKVNGETPLKAILMLGDGAYRFARLAEYRRLYEPTWGVPALKAITYPIPGNHEYLENPSGGGYYDYWNGEGQMTGRAGERGKGYYSFELGPWHIIALNSNEDCKYVACGEGSAQLAWLKADLAANKAFCTLAMVHNPRYQSGTHRGDTPALAAAWNAMYDAGVDVVLSAHEHNYQQFAPMDREGKLDREKGIRSFVIGTGGGRDFRAVFNNARMATEEKRIVNQSGVFFLTVRARDYTFRWLHTDGRVGAEGSGTCH